MPENLQNNSPSVEDIPIEDIRRDGGTQPRARLDESTIQEYTASLGEGIVYPPVTLFYDGEQYWLADGFHRVKAHEEAGRSHINAEVRTGTRREAILYSVGANAAHGLRRSNADKRRAVETLLSDKEWRKWSDREIASRCSVSQTFVGNVRREIFGEPTDDKDEGVADSGQRLAVRGGKTYTVRTQAIGQPIGSNTSRRKRKTKEPEAQEPIVVRPRRVKKGETWKLGNRHLIFCGETSSKKFESILPDEISLLLTFPSSRETWIPTVPPQARSALSFYSPYGEDLHLETIRDVIKATITGTTDADDAIAMLGLPDPSLFLLIEDLQCHCYCAEPDPQQCTNALTAWSITKQPITKLKS